MSRDELPHSAVRHRRPRLGGAFASRRGRGALGAAIVLAAFLFSHAARADTAPPPTPPPAPPLRVLEAIPRLDGALNEWIGREPDFRIDRREQLLPSRSERWGGPADLSARGWWGVTGNTLWLAFEVRDQQVFHDSAAPWWHGDSIELFIDPHRRIGEPADAVYGPDCLQLFLLPAHPHLPWGVVWRGTTTRFDDAALTGLAVRFQRPAPDLTTIELRWNLADLGIRPGPPRVFGFALALNDADDGPGQPGTYMSWNEASELYRDPRRFSEARLPAREAELVPWPDAPSGPSWFLLLLLVGGVGALTLLLVGPGLRRLERVRTRHLGIALAALVVLGLSLDWIARGRVDTARSALGADLAVAAREATPIVVAARAVGALTEATSEAQAASLAALLQGEPIAATVGVDAVAYVPLRADGRIAPPPSEGYDIALDAPLDLPLPTPLASASLGFEVHLAMPRRDAATIGSLLLEGSRGAVAQVDLVAPGGPAGVARIDVALRAAPSGGWTHLRFTPTSTAARARLRRLFAADDAGVALPQRLPSRTNDGVPVLAHPRQDAPNVLIGPGGRLDLALPVLLGGADRLWFVFGPDDGQPVVPGGVARVTIRYANGEPDVTDLMDTVHFGPTRYAEGIPRPLGRMSRVAFSWPGADGFRQERDAVPLRLDPSRRPERVTIENNRGPKTLTLLAASLVRTRTSDDGALVRVVLDEDAAADRALLAHVPSPLADRLPRTSRPGEDDALRVERETQVGPPEATIPLRLEARLDADAAVGVRRLSIARFAALGLGVFLAVLLAARWARRLPRLGARLTVGVLVAALVPLLVTLFLLESKQRRRLETDAQRELDDLARGVDAHLASLVRETDELARRLASHLHGLADDTPAEQMPAAIRSVVPPGIDGAVLFGTRRAPALLATIGDIPFAARRVLEEADRVPRLTASPWDGPLVLARRHAGRNDATEVVVARRVGRRELVEAFELRRPDASVALVNDRGDPLALGGELGAFAADRFRQARDVGSAPTSGRHGDALLAAVPVESARRDEGPLWVVAASSAAALDAAIADEQVPLLWLGLLGFALVACSAVLVARQVASPIASLAEASEAMRRGEFGVPLPPAGGDEVGRLSRAFEQMRIDLSERMDDLAALRRAQDQLTEHLDHDVCVERVLSLLHETTGADVTCLVEAGSGAATLALLGRRRRAERGDESDPGDGRRVPIDDAVLRALPAGTDGLADLPPATVAEALAALAAGTVRWRSQALSSGGRVEAWALFGWKDAAATPPRAARRRLPALGSMAAATLHRAHLYRVALLDEVTRVPGATAFEARLRRDIGEFARGGQEISLVRIGLDHAERRQREHGVEASRRLLQAVASALVAEIGDVRRVGRIGPTEFGLRVAGRSPGALRTLAERVRERIAKLQVPAPDGSALTTTASIGLATCPADARSAEFLLAAAATAMAVAVRDGGDGVVEAGDEAQGAVDVPPFEEGAVFRSVAMVAVVEAARRAARSDSSVLITGETGTGKEVLASLVHRHSARSTRPLVSVNCAAFPDTLLESELFGHERGAFTGADRRREGRFEVADGGTLFLDEIGEMSAGAQAKLLRVLQERSITRLGGSRPIPVDVRILAATNRDLERSVESGRFREDLYYRLNVIRLVVPPLRERREEIPLLVDFFLAEMRRRNGRGPARLAPAAMDLLFRHPWPGNVRELRNTIERCAVMCDAEEVGPEHVHLDPGSGDARGGLVPRRAPADHLHPRQQALLAFLARHGRCTSREYCELTGTSARTALRDLADLIDRGHLVREGKRRGAVYRLA